MPAEKRLSPPDFFLKLQGVERRPGEQLWAAFNRAARLRGWRENTLKKKRAEFEEALGQGALEAFANDKLETWQQVILNLDLVDYEDLPQSKTKCKELLSSVLVNIVEYQAGIYRVFPKYQEFRKFTKKNPFPRQEAKRLHLNPLLRKVF